MMNIEELQEKRKKYQEQAEYFKKIGFERLKGDFADIVKIIDEFIAATQVKETEVQTEESEPAPAQEGEVNETLAG